MWTVYDNNDGSTYRFPDRVSALAKVDELERLGHRVVVDFQAWKGR